MRRDVPSSLRERASTVVGRFRCIGVARPMVFFFGSGSFARSQKPNEWFQAQLQAARERDVVIDPPPLRLALTPTYWRVSLDEGICASTAPSAESSAATSAARSSATSATGGAASDKARRHDRARKSRPDEASKPRSSRRKDADDDAKQRTGMRGKRR